MVVVAIGSVGHYYVHTGSLLLTRTRTGVSCCACALLLCCHFGQSYLLTIAFARPPSPYKVGVGDIDSAMSRPAQNKLAAQLSHTTPQILAEADESAQRRGTLQDT